MVKVKQIYSYEINHMQQLDRLLHSCGLRRDTHLDATYGIFDETDTLQATASAYKNTLRCIAVDASVQGSGLLAPLMSELIADRNAHGFYNLFVYTKKEAARFFESLGFYRIASVRDTLVFLENKKNGFARYCAALQTETSCIQAAETRMPAAAIVMNANPFTLGHACLIEAAAAQTQLLHIFIVSDSASVIPFAVRKELVRVNLPDTNRIVLHDTGDYIISSATFPSYFLQEAEEVIRIQAALDAHLFVNIAKTLHITARFVGEEPFSTVTALYNRILNDVLQHNGINLHVIPRKTCNTGAISASHVRLLLRDEQWGKLTAFLSPKTIAFFRSEEGTSVIQTLQKAGNLIHY